MWTRIELIINTPAASTGISGGQTEKPPEGGLLTVVGDVRRYCGQPGHGGGNFALQARWTSHSHARCAARSSAVAFSKAQLALLLALRPLNSRSFRVSGGIGGSSASVRVGRGFERARAN
jgi:hypothetical protein